MSHQIFSSIGVSVSKCRVCETEYRPFISFGKQPIANGFLTPDKFKDEYFFEMQVGFCENCKMVQLIDQPDREMMFHENYAFFSSTSNHMQIHFKNTALKLKERFLKNSDPFVVEIGSNDGIFLKNFHELNVRHLGVEPSKNVAEVAKSKGINTVNEFFDKTLALKAIELNGKAHLIYSANVICHIPYINSIFSGVEALLASDGVFVYEDPYLGDIIQKTSYDQIYDEHVFFFSVMSVSELAKKNNLEVFDVEPIETHGGSMRYFIAPKGARAITENVSRQLQVEKNLKLDELKTYEQFKKNVENSREELVSLLKKVKSEGKRVVGYAATSKSTTILNYCQIGPDLVEFISDTTPLKHNKFSPGMHIPVKEYSEFSKKHPEYALLFGWNHSKEIKAKEQSFMSSGGKWIEYVPNVHVE